MSPAATWYHGSGAGLKVGAWLRPYGGRGLIVGSAEVYATDSLLYAAVYALTCKTPVVYAVEPEDPQPSLPDRRFPFPHEIVTCSRARIVGIYPLTDRLVSALKPGVYLAGLSGDR
jgi:hypothetical protein